MSADKRTVTTDALETLGSIISENEKRDAIHLAVENVTAQVRLYPGQDVGPDGTPLNPVGIVDPFLKQPVQPGERFWLVVYPRMIKSLRHVWTHPAFTDEPVATLPSKAASEAWLRNFCATADCPDYETTLALAVNHDGDDAYLFVDGSDAHGDIPAEFWDHVEIVTGKKIESGKRAAYFSCSC